MRADHPLSLDSGQKSQVGRGSFIEFVLPVVWLAPSDAVMALESGSGRASLVRRNQRLNRSRKYFPVFGS